MRINKETTAAEHAHFFFLSFHRHPSNTLKGGMKPLLSFDLLKKRNSWADALNRPFLIDLVPLFYYKSSCYYKMEIALDFRGQGSLYRNLWYGIDLIWNRTCRRNNKNGFTYDDSFWHKPTRKWLISSHESFWGAN